MGQNSFCAGLQPGFLAVVKSPGANCLPVAEVRFYEAFFEDVSIYVSFNALHWNRAYEEACSCGLAPIDALHVAAAILTGCEEFVTTERASSRLHRARNLKVVSIA